MRLFAEFGFVALGMAFTLISGGIDLSVGAIFAVCNFTALFCLFVLGLPAWLVVVATLLTGAVIGAGNGILIGYLKARPFLTTLVTLIILRAGVNLLNERYATVFATNSVDSDAWDFLGEGSVLGVPVNAATLIVVAPCRPHLPQPLALRLASDRDRREPQGGAPCRHPRRADAVRDLHAVGRALRRRRHLLRRAPGQHRIRPPASAGNSRR